ncbi:DUF2798 domain-containing protein [Celeribacter marinus]|uniref:Uncharacterized protein n=1 Tax=Celeribacter marinus TaxID=1397108 RepID=A0A0N7HIS5_9RHOB|nr:DUF2798 domain-containing protein [Celeribacter marinus]ALI56037.1 hypothetical protein IMCC12053_2090 [Celeribacter marinus]SFK95134.1 Protein of unknown function [Celeribacter marinus]
MTDDQIRKKDKVTIILAQVFISCMMAFFMTLIFGSILPGQLHTGWVSEWMLHFATAWPVAFVFSLGVGPIAFFLSNRIATKVWG